MRQAGAVTDQYGGYARTALDAGRGAVGDYTGLNTGLVNTGFNAAKGQIDTNMTGNDYLCKGYAAGLPAWQQGQNALASSQAACGPAQRH